VPSSPAPEAPLLHFELPDGRAATLLLSDAATVLSVEDRLVSSWDLGGRPYALVRDEGTYRRGLDGGLLHKREATAEALRVRRRISALEGEPVVEAGRREAELALAALVGLWSGRIVPDPARADGVSSARAGTPGSDSAHIAVDVPGSVEARAAGASLPGSSNGEWAVSEATRRLRLVASMDAAALRDDAERFLAASGPVGILPPDQYLALVVRVTEGCSWNACTFCSLYRGVPFRWKTPDELRAHVSALLGYFGESIALRRSVFLGDANALCLAHERLQPLFDLLAREFPNAPFFSFVDAWTGHRKTAVQYREYAARGLRRVYVGLETGDPGLLARLAKPGAPDEAVELVEALHEAGLAAGVIVLLGAGGGRFSDAHVARTAAVLTRMRLGPGDIVYFSELVDDGGLEYGRRAAEPDLKPLTPDGCADQRRAILEAFRPADPAHPPRTAVYDIREFVY
jgi:hypothetical protein